MRNQDQSVVEIVGLTKGYLQGGQTVAVLADLQLSLSRGDSVAIVGVSGTGKSTLLNILGGIDPADTGEVRIEGQDIVKLSAGALARYRREKVGFVFQFYNLLPTLTAVENVMSGWEAAGLPTEEAEKASLDMLVELGLGKKALSFPEQLSGGEQQRVAIARALVKRPSIVLADEPTGNLDPKTAASTTRLLLDQAKQFASALIVVTHNPQIGEHTNRTLVLRDGRLEAHAPIPLAAVREHAA